MFKRFALFSIAVLILAVAYALTVSQANAVNETVVNVTMQEWKMEFAPGTVQVGSPVRLEMANKGVIAHNVVIEKAGEVDKPLNAEVNGKAAVAGTGEIAPGTSKTLTWTFTEPGTYWAACHLPGHFEAGMKIAFTVVAAPVNVPATTTNAPATTTNAPATTTNAPAILPATDDEAAARSAQRNQRLLWLDMMLYPDAAP
jgi:uncharacterized cupredoxin-like copper-binding protein